MSDTRMAPQPTPLVLTTADVAELLQVRPDTVENLCRVGVLRCVKVGKHKRFLPADVRAFVERLADV